MKFKKLLITALASVLLASSVYASDFKIVPPTTNADGTPIYDALGYKIHCGNIKGKYTITKDAGNLLPSTANGECLYPVLNVIPTDGRWYCVATAYYMWKPENESGYSNELFFIVSGGVVPDVAPGFPTLSLNP